MNTAGAEKSMKMDQLFNNSVTHEQMLLYAYTCSVFPYFDIELPR